MAKEDVSGTVLVHAALPNEFIGIQPWPEVPVRIHFAVYDPWVESDHVSVLCASVQQAGAGCEVCEYPDLSH
jgi:predicted esterase